MVTFVWMKGCAMKLNSPFFLTTAQAVALTIVFGAFFPVQAQSDSTVSARNIKVNVGSLTAIGSLSLYYEQPLKKPRQSFVFGAYHNRFKLLYDIDASVGFNINYRRYFNQSGLINGFYLSGGVNFDFAYEGGLLPPASIRPLIGYQHLGRRWVFDMAVGAFVAVDKRYDSVPTMVLGVGYRF
jgi:hypothetical protein